MLSGPTLLNSIFVGDRVADVARALGCYPKAMIGGQVPMVERAYPFAEQLECILCVMGPKRKLLYKAYEKMGIEYVVLENSGDEPNPASIAPELEAKGLRARTIDFTHGIPHAIEEAGRVFGREKAAAKLLRTYEKDIATIDAPQPALGKRVLVLLGIANPEFSRRFLLIEAPGCHLDDVVLRPLGCENVGQPLIDPDREIVMEGVQTIEGPLLLEKIAPDVIALTGDALTGQLAIREALARCPSLAHSVPALKNQAVYALPHCCSAEPLSHPANFGIWKEALSR
ncbi:ABC-type Fe3+-hydroxamate transport system substrate-binding protein [Desulfobaculum xiamenense]|uniref:ABC-type Fe3+-hydroxamate transport system substrate-binding protein n=1 Tax=Desulfobaculum xiamenense TaxID=995050 RepID=A0A846QI23_9BACT|nr:ABC transporter substrate-binding protein [Desulfobaculum xiamenense]NJB67898.1 ABC-type Fe3+-hydroxamate transport system substrate-binding protein [Desulfobaculum xiamenense]